MTKIKLLTVLITALVLLAMPAAPAGAWFKSRNQAKTTGSVKLGKTIFETSTMTVECNSAGGEWSIQTKGQFKDHEKSGKQEKTAFGPNLYVKLQKWNNCKGTLSGFTEPAIVNNCTFQFQQEQESKGPADALVSVITPCQFGIHFALKCPNTLFPGEEQSNINAFLKQVKAQNSAKEVIATANVEGLDAKGCSEMNVENIKLRSEEGGLIEEGLELA
ncbi:MAG TPA: hypothetical protein VGY76_03265 [Solirubrobacteraceae bacterium]|jgi:hypothetical protein|nr:hypothetical protein [Solirubrobacteraceae bacterium]